MGYTVHYQPEEKKRYPVIKKPAPVKAKMIFLSLFLVMSLLVVRRWAERIGDFLLPGNGPVTRQASERFFRNIKQGQPLKTAFSEFCIEIVENA